MVNFFRSMMCVLEVEVGTWPRHEHGKSKCWRNWQMLDHRQSCIQDEELEKVFSRRIIAVTFQQHNTCGRLVGTRSEVAKHTLVVPSQHIFLSPSYQTSVLLRIYPPPCGYPSSARGRVPDWSRAIIGVPFLWPVMGV